MKRAATGVMTLVGLVLVICAVMGAVLLGPHGTWHTELHVPAGRSAVVVSPSLASVIGPRISLEASADGDAGVPLFAGRARPDDADALVDTADRLVVDGLDGARELSTSRRSGTDPVPAPADLDVWGSSATGTGDLRLTYRAPLGAQTVVLARTDGRPLPAMTLRLAWSDRTWLWLPAVLAVVGLALVLLARRVRRPASASGLSAAARRRRRLSTGASRPRPGAGRPAKTKHVGK
ncbi:PH domain-containing protein, partial [Angustibacter peucedani]